jgi:carboxypeptidase C (cathepsin A)
LLIWLQGGPGKSSQFAAYEEVGPLGIGGDKKAFTAFENPWSWNFYAHLLFVDQPIGTGLSYSKVKNPTDTPTATKHFVNFLSNFLKNTPLGLKNNPLYLAGEGYAGHFVPAFAEAINKNRYFLIFI